MIKHLYRTYDPCDKVLHWRESGGGGMSMLCGRGNFIDWSPAYKEGQYDPEICQECDVQYVLEMMS
jgi:hypothetical protein